MVLGLVAIFSKIAESYTKYGLRILAISGVVLAIIWVVYVFRQKEKSMIDPNILQSRFSRKQKIGSIAILFIALVGSVAVWIPAKQFKLPTLTFEIENKTNNELMMESEIQFFLSLPETPISETQVGVGKIKLDLIAGSSFQSILVKPNTTIDIDGSFLTPIAYENLYKSGQANILYTWQLKSGRILSVGPIPFREEWMIVEPIEFKIDSQ